MPRFSFRLAVFCICAPLCACSSHAPAKRTTSGRAVSDAAAPAPEPPRRQILRAPDPSVFTPAQSPLLNASYRPAAASAPAPRPAPAPAERAPTSTAWAGGLTEKPPRLTGPELEPADFYERVRDSVFRVIAGDSYENAIARQGDLKAGSAVAISKNVLVTNCHVVEDARAIVAYGRTGFVRVRLLKADAPTDRCALEVVDDRELVPIGGVRGTEDLRVGERVFSVGSPRGFENTLGEGIVSGLHQVTGMTLIQTTAQISAGSSGGGLFDAQANLIGITTLKHTGGESLNFAIPAASFWSK